MKKISDILRKKQVLYPLIAFAGFILGWLLFSPSSSSGTTEGILSEPPIHDTHGSSHDLVQDESAVWTCSMHPQIRQDKPMDKLFCTSKTTVKVNRPDQCFHRI